jgi:hypothetical protein
MVIPHGRVALPVSDCSAKTAMKTCCDHPEKEPEPVKANSCCLHSDHVDPVNPEPLAASKFFCPMCPGVTSDLPGDCPKCGMALERNPPGGQRRARIYTCPMHPEVVQDHPGDCPKCGMALEPMSPADDSDDHRGPRNPRSLPQVLDRPRADDTGPPSRDERHVSLVAACT